VSAVAHSEGGIPRVRSERWAGTLAVAFALVMVAAVAEIVIDGSVGHSALIPESPRLAGWLSGLGEKLGYRVFLIALLAFSGAYAGLAVLSHRSGTRATEAEQSLRRRRAIALVALLQLIVFVGPILLSTDLFSYIAYARMAILHGINPYLHGPIALTTVKVLDGVHIPVPHDPVFKYIGPDWWKVATAYGPVYTLLSFPFAPLGIVGALWLAKLEALLASAGTLALTWRCAKARGFDPVLALLLVGANPLYLIYTVGGAHNDLLMMLAMMGAISLMLAPPAITRGREAGAAATIVAGALIKATVAVLLPFMIVSRRRLAPILGALAALVLGGAVGYAVFGLHGVDVVSALNRDASFVSSDSFANELAHLLGKPGVFPVDHDLLKVTLVLILVHLLWRTWRGYDWIAASGWALLAISVTSTWLLAWYIVWPLPLAVVVRDRRLLFATLLVQGLFIIHQLAPLLAPVH
jgi:Glycosyltransferase family 87